MPEGNSNRKLLLLVECGLAFVIICFMLVACTGNGLAVYRSEPSDASTGNGRTVYWSETGNKSTGNKWTAVYEWETGNISTGNELTSYRSETVIKQGLWYKTTCVENGSCTSEPSIYISSTKIFVTLSLFMSGVIGLLYFIGFMKDVDQSRLRPFIECLSVAIGGSILPTVVYNGINYVLYEYYGFIEYNGINYALYEYYGFIESLLFPWTLLILAFAGVSATMLGILNFVLMLRLTNESNYPLVDMFKFPLIEVIMIIVSGIFQIALHAGDGLIVREYERFGVWYGTVCLHDDQCVVKSLAGEQRYIRATFLLVIAVCTLVSMTLYVVMLRKRSACLVRRFRIHILSYTMLAGVLGIEIFVRICLAEMMNIGYFFPWGLLLLGLSSALNFLVVAINLYVMFKQNRSISFRQRREVSLLNVTSV